MYKALHGCSTAQRPLLLLWEEAILDATCQLSGMKLLVETDVRWHGLDRHNDQHGRRAAKTV